MDADDKNPAVWADGKPRSQGNAFTNGWGKPLDTVALQRYADARQRSTDSVNKAPHGSRSVRALRIKG